jgi:hypothetical protein
VGYENIQDDEFDELIIQSKYNPNIIERTHDSYTGKEKYTIKDDGKDICNPTSNLLRKD